MSLTPTSRDRFRRTSTVTSVVTTVAVLGLTGAGAGAMATRYAHEEQIKQDQAALELAEWNHQRKVRWVERHPRIKWRTRTNVVEYVNLVPDYVPPPTVKKPPPKPNPKPPTTSSGS